MGAWIETPVIGKYLQEDFLSLPIWERGLKLPETPAGPGLGSRSLYGSVD